MNATTLATQHVPANVATAILIGTAVCFGLVPLFARGLQAAGAESATIALYRCGISALLMLPFFPTAREKRGEALLLGGAGVIMGLALVGYIEAIERAPLALVGIVYMSYPVFTLLFAWLLVHQRPNWRAWSAVGCVLAAAALALAPGAVGNAEAMALAWALPAPIAFGFIVVVLSACVHRLTLFERLSCAMLGSSLGLAPVALAPGSGPLLPDFANTWMLVAGMGFFTALIPQLLYTYAAPLVGPSRSAATGSFELLTMIAVGWLAFGEAVGVREAFAAGLVLTAVFLSPAVKSS